MAERSLVRGRNNFCIWRAHYCIGHDEYDNFDKLEDAPVAASAMVVVLGGELVVGLRGEQNLCQDGLPRL